MDDRQSPGEINRIAKQVFQGIYSHYYEKLFNVFSAPETLGRFFDSHMQSSGIDNISNALESGKGALLITGHYGGVEFMPGYLGRQNLPITIVVKFATERVRQKTLAQARRFNTRIVDAEETPNVLREIIKNLKDNRIVITQCDEIDEWRPSRREQLKFLGRPTRLDRSMALLIKRAAVPTFFAVMHRTPEHRYSFIATPWEEMVDGQAGAENRPVGEVLLKFLEQNILEHPEQWYQWKKLWQLPTPVPAVPTPAPLAQGDMVPALQPSLG